MVLVAMLICVNTNHSSVATVLSFEKKEMKTIVVAGSLTNESCVHGSLSDVGVTMFCEINRVPCFVCSANECRGRIESIVGYNRYRFSTMKKINAPVETYLNRTIVRCLSVNVSCSDFGEHE